MERVETPFEAWKFTEEEMRGAKAISAEHRCYLKTLLAETANAKLRIYYDPHKPMDFVQEEAYLTGQMAILELLLSEDPSKVSRPKRVVQPEAKT